MSEIEDDIIILTDAEGNDVEFEYLTTIPYLEKEYVALLPLDEEMDEVVILEVQDDGDDNALFLPVESEEILTAVFNEFKELMKDEFEFEDEE